MLFSIISSFSCFINIEDCVVNPLPHMPILGFSNSAVNKDMMSKIWTDEGYNYLLE